MLHSHRRENLKSYIGTTLAVTTTDACCSVRVTAPPRHTAAQQHDITHHAQVQVFIKLFVADQAPHNMQQ
jgi:hypothetical protein